MIPEVSHPLFCAYMKGGRRWPQLRGGINIFLMNGLLSLSKNYYNFRDFADSQFSNEQLRKIKHVMHQDHEKAGVILRKELSDTLMNREWKKAKASVLFSLHHYIQQTDPSSSELSHIDYEPTYYISEVMQLAKEASSIDLLHKIASTAQQILLDNHDLAQLYHLTCCGPEQRRCAFLQSPELYLKLLHRYGIKESVLENPDHVKLACLEIISDSLESNLKNLSPDIPVKWISWGFTNPKDSYDSTS